MTGEKKWEFTTGDVIISSPLVKEDGVYIDSGDSTIYALNAKTGEKKWDYKSGGYLFGSPVESEGVISIRNSEGIFMINNTGILKGKYATNDNTDSSPVIADGILYLADENSVQALRKK